MTAMTTYMVIIAGMSNVLKGKRNNRLNYFNEVCLVFHCYLYFLLSKFVPNPEIRYLIGYFAILNTIINFSVNVFFLATQSAGQTILKCRRKKHKMKLAKFKKQKIKKQ
jgi:hypothetical protein